MKCKYEKLHQCVPYNKQRTIKEYMLSRSGTEAPVARPYPTATSCTGARTSPAHSTSFTPASTEGEAVTKETKSCTPSTTGWGRLKSKTSWPALGEGRTFFVFLFTKQSCPKRVLFLWCRKFTEMGFIDKDRIAMWGWVSWSGNYCHTLITNNST